MNAKIDTKTPSGKSLEGFPQNLEADEYIETALGAVAMLKDYLINEHRFGKKYELHKGDKIIIEIL